MPKTVENFPPLYTSGYCIFDAAGCDLNLLHPTTGECILARFGAAEDDLLDPMPAQENADAHTNEGDKICVEFIGAVGPLDCNNVLIEIWG